MKPRVMVFYAGLLYGEYNSDATYRVFQMTCSSEVYNGGYAYCPTTRTSTKWFRMDGTPCLLADVPKEL